ncbi:hypothetical protein ACFFX4_001292 [Citrobacter farmeri]
MLRIGQVETTATSDGLYTDGSVAGGVAATRLRAAAFNAMQEELAHIVEEGGDALSIDDMTQVLKALKKLFLSRSNPFGDIALDGPEAIALALSNLQLGEAAKRNVGTGANQIPDMNSFLCSFASNGYMKFPGGLIVQWANAGPLVGNSSALLSFPIPFPNQLLVAVPYTGSTVAAQNLGVSLKYESRQSVTLFASTTSTSTSCGAISIGH